MEICLRLCTLVSLFPGCLQDGEEKVLHQSTGSVDGGWWWYDGDGDGDGDGDSDGDGDEN